MRFLPFSLQCNASYQMESHLFMSGENRAEKTIIEIQKEQVMFETGLEIFVNEL